MNFAIKIAWKYFRARRKSLARLTTIIAVVGIAAGVASLILAQSLARGFRREMQEKILSNTAHITVFRNDSAAISDWQNVKSKIEQVETVRTVEPTTYESILIVGAKTTSYAVLRLTENSSETENKSEARNSEIEISVGAELAEKAGMTIGDEADIILPAENNFAPETIQVRVAGIFRTGLYDYDSTWIRISTESFKRLYGGADFAPTILNVTVNDVYAADKAAQKIRAELTPEFRVLDWQEANRPLFAALSLERKVAFGIISLIIFIAVLNITTTLTLLINERRLDIAVLRTCGAKTKNLIAIFLIEGLLVGLTGIIIGTIFGLAGCLVANYFRLINIPADVYALSYIPLIADYADILQTAAVAFGLSLAAAFYPARRASRIKPLENMRIL